MDHRRSPSDGSHYNVNGASYRTSHSGGRVDLQSLAVEEQESIQYLEEIINSLEKSLKEDAPTPAQVRLPESRQDDSLDGAFASPSPKAHVGMTYPEARMSGPKDDIIDLVRPDLVQTKEPSFSPTHPDFQSKLSVPESHFDFKPRHEPMDSLSAEYHHLLPSGTMGTTENSYHPPGSIPTPVLIAQKIAENQAGGASTFSPSSLLRQHSPESEKPSADAHAPPPTSVKPSRFPANISMSVGNREQPSQSLANVNIHERKAQMLANLSGTQHPFQEELLQPTEPRNTPTRSVSFRDPTPDKSRMEALSKLGLTRNRAFSGGATLLTDPDSPLRDSPVTADRSVKPEEPRVSLHTENTTSFPEPNFPPPPVHDIDVETTTQAGKSDSFKRRDERKPQGNPASAESTAPALSEVTSLEFNSYGGKSIVVKPTASSRTEPVASPPAHDPKHLPAGLAKPCEYNSYGGKSKVMTPVPAPRSDLPDILSSHINKSYTPPPKLDPTPPELNSYGGKSRTIIPSGGSSHPANIPTRTVKPPAPTPAPKPNRNTFHGTPSKAPAHMPHTDHKRRSGSLFRPQGITVQFSGRGATDESRKEALRKLGLLKES
ncbi:specifically androgen-regulated gene protein [Synchiropus splendidus]|uniref:specifically androgen-regulated gene protein n=1 Tax=Synchiropus splendidus TaxID=270530 RepID=UPI00237D8F20|nr:specifically androgen-regulated gene protein [Synchiropus splendidus]